jgi:hypothetical protein
MRVHAWLQYDTCTRLRIFNSRVFDKQSVGYCHVHCEGKVAAQERKVFMNFAFRLACFN